MKDKFTAILCSLLLAACSGEQGDDLDKFIQESGNNLRGRIDPLPEVKAYEPVVYNADGSLYDPFMPRKAVSKPGGLQPDLDRPREPGESYPLESLKFMGSLSKPKEKRALLKAPDNTMLEVKIGQYLGQNFGLVTDITDTEIQLKEIVQDEVTGEWVQRQTSVNLQE